MSCFTIRRGSPYIRGRDVYCIRSAPGHVRPESGYPAVFSVKTRVGGSPYREEMAKIFGRTTSEKLEVSRVLNGVVVFENRGTAEEFSARLPDHPDVFLWPTEVVAVDSQEFFRMISDPVNGSVAVLVSYDATGLCPVDLRDDLMGKTHACDFID